ncbi:MAG: alternative ribosome rescue aminoacyl-tRNA hydrolase ArfB [Pseudomonadota bacterium]
MSIRITPQISIEDDELVERFVRASGPGGQNVNKVSTAVELRFDAIGSPNLPDRVKARLRRIAGRKLTQDGVLVIQAERHRLQSRNRDEARDRLVDLLREAAAPPPPKRIATKPSRAAQRRRVDAKKQRGAVKNMRGKVRRDD